MKFLIITFLLISPLFILGQEIKYHINGMVVSPSNAKYAYLSTLSHQTSISSPKLFIMTPIIDGKFAFEGTFDLEGKKYQNACVFIDERGNISKEELESKFKHLVWVVGRDNNLKHVILEDLSLGIENKEKMFISKVLDGGLLTKQYYERALAKQAKNKKLVEFIKKYPESPISFNTVVEMNEIIDFSDKDRFEALYGTREELFMALSETLKNSKEGIILKKEIEDKFKIKK